MFNICMLMNNGNMSLICKLVSFLPAYDYVTDYKQNTTNVTANSDYQPVIAHSFWGFPNSFPLLLLLTTWLRKKYKYLGISKSFLSSSKSNCYMNSFFPWMLPAIVPHSCDHVTLLSWLASANSANFIWQHLSSYHILWLVGTKERKVNKTPSLAYHVTRFSANFFLIYQTLEENKNTFWTSIKIPPLNYLIKGAQIYFFS